MNKTKQKAPLPYEHEDIKLNTEKTALSIALRKPARTKRKSEKAF